MSRKPVKPKSSKVNLRQWVTTGYSEGKSVQNDQVNKNPVLGNCQSMTDLHFSSTFPHLASELSCTCNCQYQPSPARPETQQFENELQS